MTTRQINQRYEERVANKCDRHFSTLVPKRDGKESLYTHLFRAVYATIASHWYCPITVPEMEYRAAIQGHYKFLNEKDEKLRRSLASERHYFDYQIADGSGNIDGRLGIKLGCPGVEVIEYFRTRDHHKNNSSNFHPISSAPSSNNKNPSKTTRVKSSPKQEPIMNTNKQSSSLSEAVVSLQLSLSRLESLASLLDLSQTETINTLVDWAEAGASLANELNIENPTPESLTAHVMELEENYASLSTDNKSLPRATTHTQSGDMSPDEQQRLLISVSSLSNSVEYLTKALFAEGKGNSSPTERVEGNSHNHQRDRLSEAKNSSKTKHTNPNGQKRRRRISSDNRKRDTPEVMNEDINRGIDAIIEFNNVPERPHRQKFCISCPILNKLTGRATNSISNILKERSEEIHLHHEQHQIDDYHNRSRRDDNGNNYPTILSEPEINYQKITEITQDEN